jgi:hypothetical protein
VSVDPTQPRKILVVHGVQAGSNDGLDNDERVRELVQRRLGSTPIDFTVDLYRYENINDAAQNKWKRLIQLITSNPIGSKLAQSALDLVGDVVINLADGATARQIRKGLRETLIETYENGNPCYVVAHSLGSIYAFDVINELMKDGDYFDRGSRKTWPVQGLVTIGSPIGLGMFRVAGRRSVAMLGTGNKWFKWLNYWDRTDPVVSGKIFGTQLRGFEIAEKFTSSNTRQGWVIQDITIDTGKSWLLAHVAYWDSPAFGDGLFSVIAN